MSALSHISASSATLALQAFAIATGIVAVGGAVIVWGVRETLGVKDVIPIPPQNKTSIEFLCIGT